MNKNKIIRRFVDLK